MVTYPAADGYGFGQIYLFGKKKYNPFLAQGNEENWELWQQYLVLAMARCTDAFERLPLVQDKKLLDNILYSGVWGRFRTKGNEEGQDGSV